jgi:hypothetical protein
VLAAVAEKMDPSYKFEKWQQLPIMKAGIHFITDSIHDLLDKPTYTLR